MQTPDSNYKAMQSLCIPNYLKYQLPHYGVAHRVGENWADFVTI